jgi:hypothetical protein
MDSRSTSDKEKDAKLQAATAENVELQRQVAEFRDYWKKEQVGVLRIYFTPTINYPTNALVIFVSGRLYLVGGRVVVVPSTFIL